MPIYNFTGTNSLGQTIKGTIEALDEREARLEIRRRLDLRPQTVSRSWRHWNVRLRGTKVEPKDLVSFTFMFAALVRAAVPLDQALKILMEQTEHPTLRQAIQRLVVDVESGHTLRSAMAAQPKVFPTLYTNMIGAGEHAGSLETMLGRIAVFLEKTEHIRARVRGALTYPIVLLVVAAIAVGILLAFVVPQFVLIFEEAGVDLPLPTVIAVAASNFLREQWPALAAGAAGLAGLLRYLRRVPGFVMARDQVLLRLPIFGPLMLKAGIARFTRTLATMVGSGVGIVEALEQTADVAGNIRVSNAVRAAQASVVTGSNIAQPLRASGVFPPMVVSMVAIGETAGSLDSMLDNIADYYEMETNRTIDGSLKLIEPAMLVGLGIVIALIVGAVYLPMFDMMSAVANSG
jgi:type IV pilus assembly protein PilC